MAYSCKFAVRQPTYPGADRFNYKFIDIPDTSSKLCRYDMRESDRGCDGCTRESDVEFLRNLKEGLKPK